MSTEELKDYTRSRLMEFLRANPEASQSMICENEGYYIVATPEAMARISIASKAIEN